MITRTPLHELRITQLKPYRFDIRSMRHPYSRKGAEMIQKIVTVFNRKCIISLADGGIMVDAEPEMLEQALLSARLTRLFFEPLPPTIVTESALERLDKVEKTCKNLGASLAKLFVHLEKMGDENG